MYATKEYSFTASRKKKSTTGQGHHEYSQKVAKLKIQAPSMEAELMPKYMETVDSKLMILTNYHGIRPTSRNVFLILLEQNCKFQHHQQEINVCQ